MKIGIMGYGKMGKEVEHIALQKGHEIAWKLDKDNVNLMNADELKTADVVIEFTSPESVLNNIQRCMDLELPVVVGSTGWYHDIETVKSYCSKKNGTLLYASNFSIGVNIFFAINSKLSKMMNQFSDYQPEIKEVHHTQKLDAPSGTAITLARIIENNIDRIHSWEKGISAESRVLSVVSERIDDVPGTHHVKYTSDVDEIELIHTAYNRKGFALGAVIAAEWLKGKKGFYEISEMYNLEE